MQIPPSPFFREKDEDEYWMRRALDLAERGIFSTWPNPRVGCVVVKDGALVGAGFHAFAGQAHAEVHALAMAGEKAKGATVYVTLEPCAHFGRTPPCVQALIQAQVVRVVVACSDSNPLVAGRGLEALRAAGITVRLGVLEAEARALNRAFFHHMRTGLPWVALKIAASLDGRTALANGESQWITGEAARLDVQRHRLQADVVLAGSSSVVVDNARLSARFPSRLPQKQPLRLILDSALRLSPSAAVFQEPGAVAIATLDGTPDRQGLEKYAEIWRFPPNAHGKVSLLALLKTLGQRGWVSVWVEAGSALAGAFLDAALVNELHLYLSPSFLGADARPLAQTAALKRLSDRMRYRFVKSEPMGDDWHFVLQSLKEESPCLLEL